jgi:probable F420-dependent oxidoreductase
MNYRFAIQGGPFGDPVALRKHARKVETLGYDELYTSDHMGAPGSGGRQGASYVVDPFIPLIVAAEATSRLRVGPLVLNNEFYNPALLARTAATVDRLTGGRLVLGLGTGYAGAEHDSIGSPIRAPGPRVSRFGESLDVLRSLLDTAEVGHDGTHLSVHFDDFGIRPAQDRVPFLIGGHGRRVVGLAGRHADIFQFTGLTHGEGGAPSGGGFPLAEVIERGRWLTESAGDRDPDIERSALVQFTSVGDDAPSPAALSERFEMDPEVIEHTPFVLAGTVEQIVDKIERLRETLGITHYVVRDPDGFAPVVEALVGR